MLADVKSRRGTLSFGGGRLNVKATVKASATGATVDVRRRSRPGRGRSSRPARNRTRSAANGRRRCIGVATPTPTVVQHPGTTGRQLLAIRRPGVGQGDRRRHRGRLRRGVGRLVMAGNEIRYNVKVDASGANRALTQFGRAATRPARTPPKRWTTRRPPATRPAPRWWRWRRRWTAELREAAAAADALAHRVG